MSKLSICSLVLATVLSGCPSLPTHLDFEVAGLTFRRTDELVHKSVTAFSIPKENLVDTLAAYANQDEFQIVYLPDKEIAINITVASTVDESKSQIDILYTLLEAGIATDIIHNHNDRDLNPESEYIGRQLYWVAPSMKDIGQYIGIGYQGPLFRYRIATKHGLLTLQTSESTFKKSNNRYFYKAMSSEASYMQMTLENKESDDLETWAENYKGIFSLSFNPTLD
ncbi:hypothetical protein GOV11_00090 [Candidatus Woesearchaeota archaeon]|nr:hypothetical protein [Candidatus Woesearchaeota archaeon]